MAICKIDRIKMSPGGSTHEQITHVGTSLTPWLRSVQDVCELIRSGRDSFFIQDYFSGMPISVGVVYEVGKPPSLRAHADGVWLNDLLLTPKI